MAKNNDVDVLTRFASANDEAVGYINRVDTATAKFRKSKRKGSIAKSAMDNLFEFPVFVSNTIPMDYATATVSLLEQIYASYLQMAISQNPIINADTAKRGLQFADYKTNTNKYLEYVDTFYQQDACHAEYVSEDCKVEFDLLSIEDKDAKVINEAYDYQPLSEFDHFFQEAPVPPIPVTDTLNMLPVPKIENGKVKYPFEFEMNNGAVRWDRADNVINMLAGADLETKDKDNNTVKLNPVGTYLKYCTDNSITTSSAYTLQNLANTTEKDLAQTDLYRAQARDYNAKANRAENPYFKANDYITTGAQTANAIASAANTSATAVKNIATLPDQIRQAKAKTKNDEFIASHLDENQALKRTDVYSRTKTANMQYVRDADCQKLNTMKPLLMRVTLNMLNKDDSLQPIEYIIGVKCHTRMVQASILPEVALYPLKEMDKIGRKVKWRAGELKFLKDIVFRIKEKKQTAADSRDPNRKWYRRLYELAHMKGDAPAAAVIEGKSLFKVFIKDKQGKGSLQNGLIPNASIIMSQTDVDNIKAQTDIDLLKPSAAKKFCGELFLLSLIIIDTDRESIKIMVPDFNGDYDVHSLAAVNKQLATLDTMGTKTRDMFKILGA